MVLHLISLGPLVDPDTKLPVAQPNIDLAELLDWNSIRQPGSYQVSGLVWGGALNTPKDAGTGMAEAGTLVVAVANDTLVQTYTDYLGHQAHRHLNGLTSILWSDWISYDAPGNVSNAIYGGELPTVATFADLPNSSVKATLYCVETDETNNNEISVYLLMGTTKIWLQTQPA